MKTGDYHYEIEGNEYVLFDDEGKEILRSAYAVAVCFSLDEKNDIAVLHKHGCPENVHAWYKSIVAKFQKSGLNDMAEELQVVQGRIPVEELNKCIQISGYVGRMYKKMNNGELRHQRDVAASIEELNARH